MLRAADRDLNKSGMLSDRGTEDEHLAGVPGCGRFVLPMFWIYDVSVFGFRASGRVELLYAAIRAACQAMPPSSLHLKETLLLLTCVASYSPMAIAVFAA